MNIITSSLCISLLVGAHLAYGEAATGQRTEWKEDTPEECGMQDS